MDRVLALTPAGCPLPAWNLESFELVRAQALLASPDALDGFDAVLLWPQQVAVFQRATAQILQLDEGFAIPVLLAIDDSPLNCNLQVFGEVLDGFVDLRWPCELVEASLRCAVRGVRLGREVALIQQAVLAEARNQTTTFYRRAVRDGLTGLYNRRHFDDILPREHARALRHNERYALVVLDVDNLKTINTNFGHDVGSRILCRTARMLQTGLRPSDYVFRWGGDEFVILLPRVDADEALAIAKSLVTRACTHPLLVAGQEVPGEITAGVAAFEGGGETAEDVFRRADSALTRAKQTHKGSVFLHGETLSVLSQEPHHLGRRSSNGNE